MFYLIHKPSGITSHDVISQMRKVLGIKRIGHAGTLDPLASGLMIVAVGNDTKLLEYVVGLDKKYQCTFRLGATSDTYDNEGTIIVMAGAPMIGENDLKRVLQEFTGDIYQVPPQYSAIKIQGKKAYEYAREGQSITIPPRLISMYSLELVNFSYPDVTIAVHCSSGTYIRTLAHDIGKRLNSGAYVTKLIRTNIGNSSLTEAIDLATVDKNSPTINFKSICPQYEYRDLTEEEWRKVKMGQAISSTIDYVNEIVLGSYHDQIVSVLQYSKHSHSLHPKKNLPLQ
ncbi:MAG: tRNA pseudouridine(55) synthase TruB [Candidatus Abawacabacteria bacterium]|nr:tRNA pseudouridine(55) synthase TruB [Candidatus Abawacabacteria bacterium]